MDTLPTPPTTTIGIVTWASHGYEKWLRDWVFAVAQVRRQPDVVIVGTTDESVGEVSWLPNWVDVVTVPHRHHFTPEWLNVAIDRCKTEWVCAFDVDDLIEPVAFSGVDRWDADVMAFGVDFPGKAWIPQPDATVIAQGKENQMSSNSPFRRWVWEKQPFVDIAYWDWGFWIAAAVNGAKFGSTNRIDYTYQVHDEQMTRKVAAGKGEQQIAAFYRTLMTDVGSRSGIDS